MKIKVKLTVWVGLLFSMIVALSTMSAIYINRLKEDTKNILRYNNNSIEYSRQMLSALDLMSTDSMKAKKIFLQYLSLQRNNITENGEQSVSDRLFLNFNTSPINQLEIRKDINQIMKVNMDAILHKSDHAIATAKEATTAIVMTGTLCFIIAFVLLFNLPSNIANPIKELTNSIQQIAAHNYEQRVHFEQHNEFGILAKSFNAMAEKLEEYSNSSVAKLLIEKKRIETLIDKMQEPVLGFGEDHNILFINEKALNIAGLTKEHVIGKNIKDLALSNDLIRELAMELFQTEKKETNKKTIKIYADGKESYFERETISIEIIPTGEKLPQHAGHVILLKNITPFKELDLAKTNFIANISHELKTPIASIKMGAQLLSSDQQTEEDKSLVQGINEDADRLLKITGELLNLTQAESGNIQIKKNNYQLDEMIEYALDTVRSVAFQKKIQLINHLTAPKEIYADHDKTIWVITNLLTNAIRYSPEQSSINIFVKDHNDKTRIEVVDEGIGIDTKYKDKIFQRYFKIPGGDINGNGLGLSICKEFIEAQGGTIGIAQNESGVGSTFYFEL